MLKFGAGQQPLEDDADSSYDDAASSTASLSWSIFEYRKIYGRSFHSDRNTDAEYWYVAPPRDMTGEVIFD